MNVSALGFMAILIFSLLVLLFITAIAVTPGMVGVSGSSVNNTTLLLATPVIAPAAGELAVTSASAGPVVNLNSQSSGMTYIIQPGDSLSQIARQYNTTVSAILAANPQLTDPDLIQPGETLILP